MPCRMTEVREAIRQTAEDFGASCEFQFGGGRHPVAILSYQGQTRKQIFSTSPSDRNAHKVVAQKVRRKLNEMAGDNARATGFLPHQRA